VSAIPGIKLSRAPARTGRTRPMGRAADALPMHATALRVPLMIKLLGANLLALGFLVAVVVAQPLVVPSVGVVLLAIIGGTIVFGALAAVALLPLRSIEAVASRVWRGDFGARVDASPVADRDMKRIGTTFNLLLDGLVTDRSRVQALATAVIDAGDRERASLARELHDSTAQQLAALVLQLSAAARDSTDPALSQRLETIREQAKATLEEVRLLSHTVHPRVLDDLGLAAALKKLGREVGEASQLEVEVVATDDRNVPPTSAAVLYRVAQAAVHNVVKHARARHVTLHLTANTSKRDDQAVLEVSDDGAGFDVADAERRRPGMGLLTMRERVALAGGTFEIESSPGKGTRIIARVPASGSLETFKSGTEK
jgi:signal transduction histidine kinase